MSIKVGASGEVTQTYTEPTDTASTLYGDGYDRCGARAHYIADADGSNPLLVHQTYTLRNGLYFRVLNPIAPKTYELKLVGESSADVGSYNLKLIIELA